MAPHPLIAAAASGRLPDWAVAGRERREHMARVAELLDTWARQAGLSEDERGRWRAAGWLHDVLRDAPASELRPLVPEELANLPGPLLHGPAAAERLRDAGVTDEEFLVAVAFHTLGDAGFGALGKALYAADFLEPGRSFSFQGRADLCARAPRELDAVALEVARARIGHLVARGRPLHPRSTGFWNALVEERHG